MGIPEALEFVEEERSPLIGLSFAQMLKLHVELTGWVRRDYL